MTSRYNRMRERLITVLVASAFLLGAWFMASGVRVAGHVAGPLGLVFEDVAVPPEPRTLPPLASGIAGVPAPGAFPRRAVIKKEILEENSEPVARAELRLRPSPSGRRRLPGEAGLSESSVRRLAVAPAEARRVHASPPALAPAQSDPEIVRRGANAIRIARPELVPSAEPEIERSVQAAADSTVLEVDAIMEWMRLNASALPPGIRRHVGQRHGDLTARAAIVHEGASFEVFLLARVPVREIHVVLVRGEETHYLIDRSFQREGRSFRTGYARRSSGAIQGVVSEEKPASSREASRFYRVFLAWWDKEELEL